MSTAQPKVHDLKIWTTFFDLLHSGTKTFEVRFNDRGYQVGDVLRLREWKVSNSTYTGRECMRTVKHIMAGGQFGIEPHHVVLLFDAVVAPHRNQYDELMHFVSWFNYAPDPQGVRPLAIGPSSLEEYCRAHSIPMP